MQRTLITDDAEKSHLRVLPADAIHQIHEKTLAVLEDIGVEVLHEGGRALLADAGATLAPDSSMIRIPPDLVARAVELTPKTFVAGGRVAKNDLVVGNGKVYARNGGGPGHIVDMETGRPQPATTQGTADYARLVDALEHMHIVAPVYAQDTPPETRDIHTLATMFANTGKHINMRLLELHSLPYILEMVEIIAGSKAAVRERPPLTMLESPIAPLKIPDVLVETLIACGEYGIPVEICSMPIAGATGPITLAGSLLMSNVEMIASVVISQLANPGAPLTFTPRIMVMDMASGYALTGSMENALLVAAGTQLAREVYGIPVNMHGPYTDAPISDCQAGIENTYFTLLPALAGADILTGAGHLQGGLVISFAQLIIDDELHGTVERALDGFAVNEGTLGLDAIAASVETGNLLMHDHTMQYLRTERYRPRLMTRQDRSTWQEAGAKDMKERAQERASHLLETYEAPPLDDGQQRALDEVIVHAAHALEA